MLEVVCAIIQFEHKILIAQRSKTMKLPLKWEFPGGKIKPGETKEAALKREIREELNLDIDLQTPLKEVEYHYPDFSIRLFPFLCSAKTQNVNLAEHKQVVWERVEHLKNYDWAEADMPIVDGIIKKLKHWTNSQKNNEEETCRL